MFRESLLLKAVITVMLIPVITAAFAQSYSISPGDTVYASGILDDLQTLSIQQQNITGDTLWLQWEKVSAVIPSGWDASVCDYSWCYTTLEDTGTMDPVLPTEYGLILIHCTPHISPGTAIIRYAVWDVQSPAQRDTLTFIVDVAATGIADEKTAPVKIVVNNGRLLLSEVPEAADSFSIIDQSGRTVFRNKIHREGSFLLPVLSRSAYHLLIEGNGYRYTTQLIIQP